MSATRNLIKQKLHNAIARIEHFRKPSSPATAQAATAGDNRVSEHWGQQYLDLPANNYNWIQNAIVTGRLYSLISGGRSSDHWLHWLLTEYFRDAPPFNRSLSICCGDGAHELDLHRSKKVRFVRGFDISEGAVALARDKFLSAGVPQNAFLFEVNDANNLHMQDRFDLMLSIGALHHVTELEDLLDKMAAMLEPGGYFVINEFVGPNRFQWTARQSEIINGVLASLDPYYLKAGVRAEYVPTPVEEMLRIDPSEAVRGEDIMQLVRERFQVEYETHFNGTLMHPLYPLLNAGLGNQGSRDFDSIVRLVLYFEDLLIRTGVLPSDFTFMICRPKGHADASPGTPAVTSLPAPTPPTTRFVGCLDSCSLTVVSGWAVDTHRPNRTPFVDIHLDGERLGKVFCDTFRGDVRAAGCGNGLCGFQYRFPASVRPAPGGKIEVFISGTNALIGAGTIGAAA